MASEQALTKAEKAFEDFDWSHDGWQKYFDGLYPTPPVSNVMHFKRKWFKANIDENLELQSKSSTTTTSSSTTNAPSSPASQQQRQQPQNTSSSNARLVTLPITLLAVGCMCSIIYVLPVGLKNFQRYAVWMFVFGYGADVILRLGTPKFSSAYWQSIVLDEAGQALVMTVVSMGFHSWVALVSSCLTAIMIICARSNLWLPKVPSIISKNDTALKAIELMNTKRYQVMQLRANFEVVLGITGVMMLFFGGTTFIGLLLYWNALRFKYQVDGFIQSTFHQIDGYIVRVLTSPMCPALLNTLYNAIKGYLNTMTRP